MRPRPCIFAILAIALLALACTPSAETTSCPEPSARPKPPAARERAAEIDALAARARELFEVPGLAIAVVHEGELLLARGYGERELGSGLAVDEHTSFAIASNTKALIATSVGLLVADGELDWDDRVVEHMPELELWDPYVTRELRVRDLLSHRVGLATWAGDLMWLSSSFDTDTILARLRHVPAAAGLRERYGYTNLMYIVAGELIERISGQSWRAFMRARLLEPLDMREVATDPSELEGRDNVAAAHIEVEGRWQTTARLDMAAAGAAGALDASVAQMSHWLLMQLDEGRYEGREIVPEAVLRETRTPHIWRPTPAEDLFEPARTLRAYGLGWVVESYRGSLMVAHGGALPGMISTVLLVPDHELGIVVLTNSESEAAPLLALQAADLFLIDEGEGPGKDYLGVVHAEDAPSPEPESTVARGGPLPEGLIGEYRNPMLGAARIEELDGALWFFAYEHGGLRCRFAGLACTWDDPNMGVSTFTIEGSTLRFRVRPDFYDPLEYTFAPQRR